MKREPRWLEKRDIVAIHEQLLTIFGGSSGLRNEALLESALASPRNHFAYGERDIFRLGAAYSYALTRDHAFVDGNKRIGFMAAYVFLGLNGHVVRATEDDVVRTMLSLAAGKTSAEELTEWLRQACAPRRKK